MPAREGNEGSKAEGSAARETFDVAVVYWPHRDHDRATRLPTGCATASERELDAALDAAGVAEAADRVAMLDGLNRLGYIWCPPGQLPPLAWAAGIPSLTTYILEG